MRIQSDRSHSWDGERIVVSFRCDKDLWMEFDTLMTEKYGNYKKSILIESLIRKYMKQKNKKKDYYDGEEDNNTSSLDFSYAEYDLH